jgi:membrane fusion protein (multidrug efflux system)
LSRRAHRGRARPPRVTACLIGLAGLLLALPACDQAAQKSGGGGAKGSPKVHLVEVVTVRSEPLRHETVRTGTLTARRSVRVFNQEEGRIDSLPVFEGETVRAEQILIRMDRRLLEAEMEKAAAVRAQAEADLARIRTLVKKRVTTQERLDRAETALKVARAEESLFRTRLEYGEIKAPFDGVVAERLVEPGDVAPRHTHLLTIIDPNTLYTRVAVSELMVPRLHEGDGVDVRIDALGNGVWPGRIGRIHPTIDPRTRQGTVEVELAPVPPGARAGQLCRVTLRTAESRRRVLPFAALRHDREGEYVFVVVDGKAELRRVRSGLRLGDRVEALAGLEDGERVVVRGFLDLSAGKSVTVTDEDGGAAPTAAAERPATE